jgi:hypothetical protein
MMTEDEQSCSSSHKWCIKDARGRKVRQLDPVSMHVLRQRGVIDAETLRKLAVGIGVGWPVLVKLTFFVMLAFLIVCLLVTGVQFVREGVSGTARLGTFAERLLYLIPPLAGLLMIWFVSARVRFKRIRKIILKYKRCPHCGYDLRMLPTDPEDGFTVCPECGCAWELNDVQAVGGHDNG